MQGDQKEMAVWFRSLEPVQPEDMVGLWSGVGIPTDHPLDGVLENLGWFGKRFHPDMRADPLLFKSRPGRLVPIEPAFFPIGLVITMPPFGRTFVARSWSSYLQKVFRAKGTAASLKLLALDGVETAAMVYDKQPVVDYFGRIDDDWIAGMMCVRDDPRRFFFKLQKVKAPDMWQTAGRATP